MKKITPFIWFEDQAEEAVKLYTSLFPDSGIKSTMRYDAASAKAAGQPEGAVMTVSFSLNGQDFTALNGGPSFGKGEGRLSLVVNCETQAEIDKLWDGIKPGGKALQCGWLQDKYGVVWQIIPANLPELIKHPKAMQAMLSMEKFDIAKLEAAANK